MITELEDLLRDEFNTYVDGVHLTPDVFRAALRRHRRRRAITATVSGTAVVTAAAVVATTAGGSGTAKPKHDLAASPTHRSSVANPRIETVGYVRQRILAAVDPEHAIVRTRWQVDGQTNDSWLDEDTGYITDYLYENGALHSVTNYPQTKAGDATTIDYDNRTFVVEHQDAAPLPHRSDGKLGEPFLDSVDGIKAAVQRSDVKIAGHGTIDGRPATHLRFTFKAERETVIGDAWFDSQTYVPLRATTTYLAASPTTRAGVHGSVLRIEPNTGPDAVGESRSTGTTWFLPRTAANLAKTQLTIPPGFRQVSPPAK